MTQGEGGRDLATYCKELGITEQDLLGKRILDVGAGLKAELSQALGDKAEVISFSPDYSNEKYRKHVAGLEKPVVAGVGQAMPFSDESFEIVLMLHVAEHLYSSSLEKIIKEIARILKKGGIAYIAPLLEGEKNYKPGQITLIEETLKGSDVVSTFEKNGQKTRFDMRYDASGPHQYVYIDQQRAKLKKEQ